MGPQGPACAYGPRAAACSTRGLAGKGRYRTFPAPWGRPAADAGTVTPMDWSHYRFHTVWALPAEPAVVYTRLEDARTYPLWWPQVREVVPIDEHCGTARFRSLLPYDLVVTVREERREPGAGLLEISMTGDLEGWARWSVAAGPGGGTRALYDQEVEVRKPLMRRLSVPCRPLFRLNHAHMMRGGLRGLAAHLVGVAAPATGD